MTTEETIKSTDEIRVRQIPDAVARRHLTSGAAPELTADLRSTTVGSACNRRMLTFADLADPSDRSRLKPTFPAKSSATGERTLEVRRYEIKALG
jgi:hypothetical protein